MLANCGLIYTKDTVGRQFQSIIIYISRHRLFVSEIGLSEIGLSEREECLAMHDLFFLIL